MAHIAKVYKTIKNETNYCDFKHENITIIDGCCETTFFFIIKIILNPYVNINTFL